MTKMNISNLKNNNCFQELNLLKQKQVKGGLFMKNFNFDDSEMKISFSDKLGFRVNGKKLGRLNHKHKIVNSETDSGSQVITSPGAKVMINGKEY